MNKKIFFVLMILSCYTFLLSSTATNEVIIKEFTYKKHVANLVSDGIVNKSFEHLWFILCDYENANRYLPHIKASKVVSLNGNEKLVEIIADAVIVDIKYINRVKEDLPAKKIYWEQADGPFSENKGYWELIPVGPNQTRMLYHCQLSHPAMAEWIVKKLTKDSIPELYKSLNEAALQ